MAMYRKRPVEVEARQLPSPLIAKNVAEDIADWCGGEVVLLCRNSKYPDWTLFDDLPVESRVLTFQFTYGIRIDTLEGSMFAIPGDYIIKGVQDEFYPCRADIFEQTYEKV